MPLQQAAALGIMQVCLPWVICLAIKFSVLIIGYSLINSISFSPFVPTKGAKFVPASGSKLACTRNERSRIS